MKINRLDVSVGVLGGLVCLFMLVGLPVWGLFIGWSWYFTAGSTSESFKKCIPPMILGYLFGVINILGYLAAGGTILSMVIICGLLVFGIMISMKFKPFTFTVSSFNSFSCMFAAYFGGATYPAVETASAIDLPNVLICAAWMMLAHFIGQLVGYVSIKLGTSAKETAAADL